MCFYYCVCFPAAMIKGNKVDCSQFVAKTDMLIKELANPTLIHGMCLQCISGRCMLCVCHGAAVRENQRLCYRLLSEVKDLLLFPVLHNRVYWSVVMDQLFCITTPINFFYQFCFIHALPFTYATSLPLSFLLVCFTSRVLVNNSWTCKYVHLYVNG